MSYQRGDLVTLAISVPHPASLDEADRARLDLYERMSKSILHLLDELDAWQKLPQPKREHAALIIQNRIPQAACSVYDAEYLGMAVDFPQFFIWSVMRDHREKNRLIKTMGADLRTQFELVASSLQTVDLGLKHLAAAIRQIPQVAVMQGPHLGISVVAEELHQIYEDEIENPIIEDRYEIDEDRPQLAYPTKVRCYVPQAYRLARYKDETAHLERESSWAAQSVNDDLGPFLMRHLESPYSVETPLLILGHPGSGKSLLTQIVAARLAYPHYTTVRVELRDVNPDSDIQAQIEAQIRKDTGRDINWADFTGNPAMSPPVVILDGYDELLQATGKLFADYLEQVRRFQHRESVQHRPVRVIVTSRITLIDKAIVPSGATIVRLEEFNNERREAWIAVWNAHNVEYFRQAALRPFTLPASEKIIQLAEQPLLLLMLALYDSSGNKLSSRPDIDQTLLYEELLTRFIERERSKGADGAEFGILEEASRKVEINKEMERLGVAAIGMFNRQDVKIRREELNADLRYLEPEQDRSMRGTRRMSRADLLLGSFFFIHESRSQLADDSAESRGAGPAAFEFLHNTFGEFLAADFILRKIIAEASAICALSGEAVLGDTLRQRLAFVSPSWFACLIHTPLHTRPNVLAMLREWSRHRLADGSQTRANLLQSLDMIVVAQLRSLLTQTSLPDLSVKGAGTESPYRPLPMLGHLAIYSLNLVLLRCFLGDRIYALDEADLGLDPSGCRPWDRLVNIWRSWFPLESLGALATLITANRDGALIKIEPARPQFSVPNASNLYTDYNVGLALADNLAAVTAGIHVASLMEMPENALRSLRDRILTEVPGLIMAADSLLLRAFGSNIGVLPVSVDEIFGQRLLSAEAAHIPQCVFDFIDIVDRMMITPRQQAQFSVSPSDISAVASLSRYDSELTVQIRNKLEARWLPYLLCSRGLKNRVPGDARRNQGAEDGANLRTAVGDAWRNFLRSPAAAPVLRAGWRYLRETECTEIAMDISDARHADELTMFDADTAAALAVLSWRGGAVELCVLSLKTIIGECEQRRWNLLDIPSETWTGLADIFTAGDLIIESHRDDFTTLINSVIGATLEQRSASVDQIDGPDPLHDVQAYAEFWLHALRIGARNHQQVILMAISQMLSRDRTLVSNGNRNWVLILMRLVRETNDRTLTQELFSLGDGQLEWTHFFGKEMRAGLGKLDVDRISMELTYREAVDLRWVVEVLREAGSTRKIGAPTSRTRRRKNSP